MSVLLYAPPKTPMAQAGVFVGPPLVLSCLELTAFPARSELEAASDADEWLQDPLLVPGLRGGEM